MKAKLVDKLFFHLGGLHRYDVVVMHFHDTPENAVVKRIIGVPGEQVQIRGGSVRING